MDCFSKDANEFRESQIKCLNEVVFESRSTLENATNLIFKSLADYSLGKIDDAWNTITDKFMKEWSAVEDIKLSTMNSLKDILSLGNPLQNLNDLDLKVNRALLQLEPLVIKTESACTESFSTILIDFSQRMQFISILVADIQYNLKTIGTRKIKFRRTSNFFSTVSACPYQSSF